MSFGTSSTSEVFMKDVMRSLSFFFVLIFFGHSSVRYCKILPYRSATLEYSFLSQVVSFWGTRPTIETSEDWLDMSRLGRVAVRRGETVRVLFVLLFFPSEVRQQTVLPIRQNTVVHLHKVDMRIKF